MESGLFDLTSSGTAVDLIQSGDHVRKVKHIRITNYSVWEVSFELYLEDSSGNKSYLLKLSIPASATMDLTEGLGYDSDALKLVAKATGTSTGVSIILS